MALDVTGPYRYPAPSPTWLALREEPVLDAGQRIVDAHHHIWNEPGNPYLLREYTSDLASGHNVAATVFVQAGYGYRAHGPDLLRCVGETEKVARLRKEARSERIGTDIGAAIVGFADLTLGDRVSLVLDAHTEAGEGAFRGVRHSVARDPHFPDGIVVRPAPEGLLLDDAYRTGLAAVARRGLSYDAMLYHAQLPELRRTAAALPDLRIVLDHFGCVLGVGPYVGREEESFRRWRSDIAELARCPNVTVKLGGLGMIICGARWNELPLPPTSEDLAQAWRPWVETCIELFGAERCMFESNFPVDKSMYAYRTCWNAFKRLTEGASQAEKNMLFYGTACRTYGIALPGSTV